MSPGPARGRTSAADGGAPRRGPARRWQLVRAGRDAVPPSTRRFMARARQRRMRAALPGRWPAGVLGVGRAGRLDGARHRAVRGPGGAGGGCRAGHPGAGARRGGGAGRGAAGPGGPGRAGPPGRCAAAGGAGHGVPGLARRAGGAGDGADAGGGGARRATAFVAGRPDRGGVPDGGPAPAGLPLVQVARPAADDPGTRAALEVLAALTPQLRARAGGRDRGGAGPDQRCGCAGSRTVVWGDATRGDGQGPGGHRAARSRRPTRIDVSAPDVVTFR